MGIFIPFFSFTQPFNHTSNLPIPHRTSSFLLPAMKSTLFSIFISLVLAVSTTLAQHVVIASPIYGTDLPRSGYTTIDLERPFSVVPNLQEIGVVIGLASCSSRHSCALTSATDAIGTVLYSGQWNPQPSDSTPQPASFGQKVNVSIPSSFPVGPAILSLTHAAIAGQGPSPFFEMSNVTVNVV